jgi:hypothetical protein
LNRAVSKTVEPLRVPWVRIPPSPPETKDLPLRKFYRFCVAFKRRAGHRPASQRSWRTSSTNTSASTVAVSQTRRTPSSTRAGSHSERSEIEQHVGRQCTVGIFRFRTVILVPGETFRSTLDFKQPVNRPCFHAGCLCESLRHPISRRSTILSCTINIYLWGTP